MWVVYELLLLVGLLLYVPRAIWRKRLPHRGWNMRLGRYPRAVTTTLQGRPAIWIHAVSVGEVLAAQPLVRALHETYPDNPLVLSTVTSSGFDVAVKQLGNRGTAIYFPLDFRLCVSRAFDGIRPRILILMESELWPTTIRLAAARRIPIAVVNGRISPRAFRGYRWVRPWLSPLLRRIQLFAMQSDADATRITQLGAPQDHVRVVGSLKWDASLGARPEPQAVAELAARIGLNGRERVIVAGSTHRGEEQPVVEGFRLLRAADSEARLIIAPRHLERLDEVEGIVRQAGLTSARLSEPRSARWDVGLVDAFGQLPCYYGLATAAVIGGSFIPHGGQNPLEAASLGKPILFGPHMHNFDEIARQLTARHAARQLAGPQDLAPALTELLAHPEEAQAMGRRAQELTAQFRGVASRTLDALRPLLR